MTFRLLLTVLASLFIVVVFAQEEPALKFTKLNKRAKVKVVELGEKVIVQKLGPNTTKNQVKGTLTNLNADIIVVDSTSIPIDSIAYLIQCKDRVVLKVLSIPVMSIGILYTGFSGLFILTGAIYNDNVYVIGGTIDLLIGLGIITAALYPHLNKGKKFEIGKKWLVESIGVSSAEDDYYKPPPD